MSAAIDFTAARARLLGQWGGKISPHSSNLDARAAATQPGVRPPGPVSEAGLNRSCSRIESRVEHAIEIDARAIPLEFEFIPRATLIERYRRVLTDAQLAELVHVALEESL